MAWVNTPVLHFALLPPEENEDLGLPSSDNAVLTTHAFDQAVDLLRRPEEEEEQVSVIVICGAPYAGAMSDAVMRRRLQKANVFIVPVPPTWLKRSDAWLVSRAGNSSVVSGF